MTSTHDENAKDLWGRLKRRWKTLPWHLRLGVQWIGGWLARMGLDHAWAWLQEVANGFLNSGGSDLM